MARRRRTSLVAGGAPDSGSLRGRRDRAGGGERCPDFGARTQIAEGPSARAESRAVRWVGPGGPAVNGPGGPAETGTRRGRRLASARREAPLGGRRPPEPPRVGSDSGVPRAAAPQSLAPDGPLARARTRGGRGRGRSRRRGRGSRGTA